MSAATHQTIDPIEAHDLKQAGEPIFVDVRTVEEFEAGHVAGSYNVPIYTWGPTGAQHNLEFVEILKQLFEPSAALIFIWRAGVRSQRACEMLAPEGYTGLINMAGGISGGVNAAGSDFEPGWQARGLPLSTTPQAGRTWADLRPEPSA